MLTDLAVYDINDYLWSNTELATLIGGEESPFYPVQQQPEPNSTLASRPYITYTTNSTHDNDQWYVMTDTTMYTIWSPNQGDSVPIANEITRHLRQMDESATMLNDYLWAREGGCRYDFLYVLVRNISFPNAVDQEGGMYGRRLTVISTYVDLNLY